MDIIQEENRLIFMPEGRIDSSNSKETEDEIFKAIEENKGKEPVFDLSKLQYISSAGLRAFLKVRKLRDQEPKLINVKPEVFEILETTGFTELFSVKKAMRKLSVDGLEVIGKGFYGTVYRLDADTIVKVYESADALNMIENEKKMSKLAFLKGIPTAISFDIVQVGDSYGSVFELINSKTFNDLIIEEPDREEEIVDKYVKLMKQVHSIEVEPGELPLTKNMYAGYLETIKEYITQSQYERLKELFEAIPADNHIVHGDIQMKNVMLSDGEPMLIDMDTLSAGQSIFDLAGLYVTYVEFGEDEPGNSMDFLGISNEMADRIWHDIIHKYYEDETGERSEYILERIRTIAAVRFLYILAVSDLKNGELGKRRIEHTGQHLSELLKKVDSLFDLS